MNTFNIKKIEPTNEKVGKFIGLASSWDKEGILNIEKSNLEQPMYAIYLGDLFSAASVVEFDKENSKAIINVVNNSKSKSNLVLFEAIEKLMNMVEENYDVEEIEMNYVKKRA